MSLAWRLIAFIVIVLVQFCQVPDARTTPMHKVLLTQRGYIQFLKWDVPVREIREFTYCIWMKSNNFTLKNSVFSYSHNETVRQISSWVSPYGRSVHLEIGNVEIMAVSVDLQERRWYHLCHSWDNSDGRFALWLDSRLVAQGQAEQMAGHVIPANGDVVVGQEYTDFDKGLEDGIEGGVLGFNWLLASAFPSVKLQLYDHPTNDPFGYAASNVVNDGYSRRKRRRSISRRVTSDGAADPRMLPGETIGEYLVRVSYEDCQLGRASPYIDPRVMIVSWTRTPVKVYGGAVVKSAHDACGQFG